AALAVVGESRPPGPEPEVGDEAAGSGRTVPALGGVEAPLGERLGELGQQVVPVYRHREPGEVARPRFLTAFGDGGEHSRRDDAAQRVLTDGDDEALEIVRGL